MATITASDVNALRKKTGAGIMDCKKALAEADGDMAKAEEVIAQAGKRKVAKSAARIAAEGVIFVKAADKKAAMIEINCETDFVARDESFTAFGDEIVAIALEQNITDVATLESIKMASGKTVSEERDALIARIGEKISIRRINIKAAADGEYLAHYRHGTRIGAMAVIKGEQATADTLARDIALHVAGMKPEYVSFNDVPATVLEKERNIFFEQVKDSGKPEDIINKMIEGKLRKHFSDFCLHLQPFVKDGDKTVEQLLKEMKAEVVSFERIEVGEGIEKVETNFAEEVMAQAKGAN